MSGFLARWLFAGIWLLVCGTAGPAEAWSPPGPKVGEVFPHSLGVPDQSGQNRSIDQLMGRKGVAVFFQRSVDWCPFCRKQLAEVNGRIEDFRRLGYEVVAISVDTVDLVKRFHDAGQIRYPILADAKGTITAALGIRDSNYPPGTDAYGVPQPGIFILDRNRLIVAKFFEQGYRTRPDLDKVLATIATL